MIIDAENMRVLLQIARVADEVNRVIDGYAKFFFILNEENDEIEVVWDYYPIDKAHLT